MSVVGQYAASQNLSLIPGVLAMAFSPILLATITRLRGSGEHEAARKISASALRFGVLLLPFAAMGSQTGSEMVAWLLGPRFSPAAHLFSVLIFGGVAGFMTAVAMTILIAGERSKWTVAIAVPLVIVSMVGYAAFIPRFGARFGQRPEPLFVGTRRHNKSPYVPETIPRSS